MLNKNTGAATGQSVSHAWELSFPSVARSLLLPIPAKAYEIEKGLESIWGFSTKIIFSYLMEVVKWQSLSLTVALLFMHDLKQLCFSVPLMRLSPLCVRLMWDLKKTLWETHTSQNSLCSLSFWHLNCYHCVDVNAHWLLIYSSLFIPQITHADAQNQQWKSKTEAVIN